MDLFTAFASTKTPFLCLFMQAPSINTILPYDFNVETNLCQAPNPLPKTPSTEFLNLIEQTWRRETQDRFLLDLFSSTPTKVIEPVLHDLLERKALSVVPMAKPPSPPSPTRFPVLTEFIKAISQIAKSMPVTLVTAFIYLERLAATISSRALGHFETAYRVVLTSMILALKYNNDGAMKNGDWAAAVQPWFSLNEINTMERQFLKCIDYNVIVHAEDVCDVLQRHDQVLFSVYFGISASADGPSLDAPCLETSCFDASIPYYNSWSVPTILQENALLDLKQSEFLLSC